MSQEKRMKITPLIQPAPAAFRSKKAPPTMTSKKLPPDQREFIGRQALDIFTVAANAGKTFEQCLSAILLSGIDWGMHSCDCRNQKKAPLDEKG